MGKAFKMAICQIKVTADKGANIKKAAAMVKEATAVGAKVITLPEMFNCPYENKYFPEFAEEYPSGETLQALSEMARSNQIYLVGGSIPEIEETNIYNTSFIFDPKGAMVGRHRKMHLFDVELSSGLNFKESDTLGAGQEVTVVDTAFGKIGIAICYDMRFPELMRLMALAGAELIIIPGAFNMTTGPAHWEMTLKMRAVDNQVYVVGASPARDASAGYVAYGHSLVADPWGEVVSIAGVDEEIIYATIDPARVKKIRNELPLLKHRRRDLYELKLK